MRSIADLFFPPVCASCGKLLTFEGFFRSTDFQNPLCEVCLPLWEEQKEQTCDLCGEKVTACKCATKVMHKVGCQQLVKLCFYRPGDSDTVGNRMVYRIKDHADRATVQFLARELEPGIRASMKTPEWQGCSFFIAYLPRRHGTVLKGGNDQAKELARALAKQLGIPLVSAIGRNKKSETPQKFLLPTQRLKNALSAFYLKKGEERKGQIAILVDDIVTSGASMAAGVRLLRRLGAKGFLAVSIATDECNRSFKTAFWKEEKFEQLL